MAACIDNSTNHTIQHLTYNSSCCNLSNSFSKLIKRCGSNGSDSVSTKSNYRYPSCPDKLNNLSRVTPQVCNEDDPLWIHIRHEAELDVMQEPILKEYYNCAILSHYSLESALAHHLAMKLSNANLSRNTLYLIFLNTICSDYGIQRAVRDDLKAVRERDPACISYVHCLLNFKGFLACQAYRIAHNIWLQGRNVLALVIQSRVSELFAVDIHPGAKIGCGIVFDHGTGIVIGETSVVGNNVTILHNVTLGGTGKEKGDRHPKIGDGVLIGTGAKVLGNIRICENAKIGAGSVVLKDVPVGATAVGNPVRLI